MVSLSNHLPPPPFMPSPSPGPGQALSNRVRPPHRPAFPHPVPPLRSSRACRRACPEPCRRNLSRACRGKRPAALTGPETSPTRPKIRQISRPLARLPLWGSRASGREYPKNPHRNHRRLPLPCRWKPASSLAPACTVPPPKGAPPRPTRHSGVRGEPALSLPKEPALSLPKGNPVVIPRPKTPPKCTPRRLKSFLEKTLTRARPPQNRPATPHRPQPPFVRFRGQNLESAIT